MLTVPVRNEDDYPVQEERIFEVVKKVLWENDRGMDWLVSVAVVNDREMKEINLIYHQTEGTTDVLSFPYVDEKSRQDIGEYEFPEVKGELPVLGDIVVSWEEAEREAERKGISFEEEIDFLVEHGMLHLLGFHHE